MKKIFYAALIVVLGIAIVNLGSIIFVSTYVIPENVVETNKFRMMNIHENSILKAKEFCNKNNVDQSRLLAGNYLRKDCKIEQEKFTLAEYKKLDANYKKADNQEYVKVCKAMSAIFDDLEYFPVAKSSTSDYWVSFDDSFGADRNYNGEYKHEGTDIMAQNNVGGYYPVVSATDGVVENLGWLEKGGYRVGIRGNAGGYFYYAHLSSYSSIKKGDKIRAGTLLGYMGDTGYGKAEGTSGNFDVHLHFGIYIKTENYEELSINPYHILKYLENKLIIANY
ncbi:MAG: M23 family metallopeptidase [Eubacterium sp.]